MALPSSATAEIAKDSQRIVFFAHIYAKEPGLPDTTIYLGTEALDIVEYVSGPSHSYRGALVDNAVEIGWVEANPRGGLTNRGNVVLKVDDGTPGKLAELSAGYHLQNDVAEIYSAYHDEGDTTFTWYDFIAHGRYVIQSVAGGDGRPLRITCQQELFGKEDTVPSRVVRPAEFPRAPEESYGIPMPYATTKYDRDARYLPAVCVDGALHRYIAAINVDAGGPGDDPKGTAYQYYPNGNKFAVIDEGSITKTQTGAVLEYVITDLDREISLLPVRDLSGSDYTLEDWNNGSGTPPTMASGETFNFQFEGIPKYGHVTDVTLILNFPAGTLNYDVELFYLGVSKNLSAGQSSGTYTLTGIEGLSGIDWSKSWDFERVSVVITANNSTTTLPRAIRLDVEYEDALHTDRKVFEVASLGIKLDESADLLNPDGASNPAIGNILGPVELLEYVLRANFFLNYSIDEIDTSTIDFKTGDSDTPIALPFFRSPVAPRKFLDDIAFLGAQHLHRTDGETPIVPPKWTTVRRRTIENPAYRSRYDMRYGSGAFLLRSIDRRGRPVGGSWTTDCTWTRLKTSDILNEFVLSIGPNSYQPGEYKATVAATGRTSLEGTCSTTSPAKKLIADSGTPFVADMVGQQVYVDGADDVNEIVAFDSSTQIELADDPGTNGTGTNYYMGANLNKKCLLSRLRHGNITNALGGVVSALLRDGIYKADFLSAEQPFTDFNDLLDYLASFLSESWFRFEAAVDWGTGCLWRERLGHIAHLYHPDLPDVCKGAEIGTIATVNQASPPGNFTLGSGEAADVEAGDLVRVMLDSGVAAMAEVDSVATDTVHWGATWHRDMDSAVANSTVYLIKRKWAFWEIFGYRPDWAQRKFRLRFQQVPGDYFVTP